MGVLYTLHDPRDPSCVRYVGYTSREPSQRLREHLSTAKLRKDRSHRANWIKSLVRAGVRPVMVIMHTDASPTDEAALIERYDTGDLTNAAVGSEGTFVRTAESVAKQRESLARFYASEDGRAQRSRLSEMNKGRASPRKGMKVSDETREKISVAAKARAARAPARMKALATAGASKRWNK